MKNLLILSGLLFLMALPGLGQKHEVGAAGSFVLGYPQGKDNSSELRCGWRAGAYYRYVPNKWIGLQSGVYVQGFDENRELLYDLDACKYALVVPVQAVVFPRFPVSLVGGLSLRQLFGETRVFYWIEDPNEEFLQEGTIKLSKHPVLGYEAGVAWNRRHFRVVLSVRGDLTSWLDKGDYALAVEYLGVSSDRRYYNGFLAHRPKSFTYNLTLEIPIWRNKERK